MIVTTNEMSENQINIKATDQTIFSLVLSYSSTYSKKKGQHFLDLHVKEMDEDECTFLTTSISYGYVIYG